MNGDNGLLFWIRNPHGGLPSRLWVRYSHEAGHDAKTGALSRVLSGDEAPPIKKYVALNGLTALTFWGSLEVLKWSPGLIGQTLLKFSLYVSMLLWLNTAFYLTCYQGGRDVESGEFQREQVKLSLWSVGILIAMELPLWLSLM